MTIAAQLAVRKAVINDVPRLQKMINGFADKNEMLHGSMNKLYENIRNFVVVEDGELLGAVGAIHVTWDDLAELKCVAAGRSPGGWGRMIVNRCLEDARELGLRRIFALTYKPEFFEKYGFKVVDRSTLPHKVWGECIKCLKYPNCNEIAMICPVTPNTAGNGHQGPQAQS